MRRIKENLLSEIKHLDKTTKQVSIEYLRLLVEVEKRSRMALKLAPFACYVLAFDNIENFLNDYLNYNPAINKKFQLIIKYEEHYLTVDVSCREHKKYCSLLDAANDKRMKYVYRVLKDFSFDRLFVVSGTRDKLGRCHHLQRDFDSCAMFAFDHAVQLSKKDIYSDLEKLVREEGQRRLSTTVYWHHLPVSLVWNAQSLSFFRLYLDQNSDKLMKDEITAYKKYVKKNTVSDVDGKNRNVAVDNIFESRLQQMLPWVKKLSQTEIAAIVGDNTYLTPRYESEVVFTTLNKSAFFQACKIQKSANNQISLALRSA